MKKLHSIILSILLLSACTGNTKKSAMNDPSIPKFTGAKNEVKLMTLDPGHFHAALVQKTMYHQVDPVVYIYAPESPDLVDHLGKIEAYNKRTENPTAWEMKVYTGPDYLEKMITEKPGNVMVVSGNNAKKTEYILKAVDSGIHVLADKPMVIDPAEYTMLEEAFNLAAENGVMLYDIMTERYEITTILQRELSKMPDAFGELLTGTADEPAITKESVHHFFKYVSGNPIKRPPWFFDATQQGESIADVGTHLVDLIQWEAFPEVVLNKGDVKVVSARLWNTPLTPEMFEKVTQLKEYPEYLQKYIDGDVLNVSSNGEMIYTLKGIYSKVSVIWNFQAPEGSSDTHYSIMRGTKCNLIIQQGEAEGYIPKLYVESAPDQNTEEFEKILETAINQTVAKSYPGLSLKQLEENRWMVEIPDSYRVGHEAHFAQVTEKYLNFLKEGKMPDWEVPNMIVKYYTTMEGMRKARE